MAACRVSTTDDQQSIVTAPEVLGASLIPHGGGAVAILIAGMVCAVIAATAALEMHRNMVAWMVATFVGTVLLLAAAIDLMT